MGTPWEKWSVDIRGHVGRTNWEVLVGAHLKRDKELLDRACLVLFLDLNDVIWEPDPPDVDEAETAILAVAAHDVDERWFADCLRQRTRVSGE
jgi:hypothetical protein